MRPQNTCTNHKTAEKSESADKPVGAPPNQGVQATLAGTL